MKIRQTVKQPAFVFVMSVVSMLVMLLIGGALLRYTTATYSAVSKAQNSLHAVAMADAGMNYLYWRQRWSATDTTAIFLLS